jgi:hypothetical protein
MPRLAATARAGSPPRVAATLILASVGAFVTSLDIVVVATALPTLRHHFGASLSDLEWTVNAYNLAFASLRLTGAALGDRFGRRKLYIIGLGLFAASSVACATAGSAGALIAGRLGSGGRVQQHDAGVWRAVRGRGPRRGLQRQRQLSLSDGFHARNQVRAPRRGRGGARRSDPRTARSVQGQGTGERHGSQPDACPAEGGSRNHQLTA